MSRNRGPVFKGAESGRPGLDGVGRVEAQADDRLVGLSGEAGLDVDDRPRKGHLEGFLQEECPGDMDGDAEFRSEADA